MRVIARDRRDAPSEQGVGASSRPPSAMTRAGRRRRDLRPARVRPRADVGEAELVERSLVSYIRWSAGSCLAVDVIDVAIRACGDPPTRLA
jgi:hypothetical protein